MTSISSPPSHIPVGHINHSLFWKNLSPAKEEGGKLADGPLKQAIERDFGSVENFKKELNTKTAAIQGSGWGWLVCHIFCCHPLSFAIYYTHLSIER